MSHFKALLTDLDGTAVTLSSDGSDVDDLARNAVEEANKQGFKIACATGRSWDLVKPVTDALGIVAPCVVEGGTRIVDPKTEKTLWEKHIDGSAVARILQIFQEETSDGMLLTHDEELYQPLKTITVAPRTARVMYLLGINNETAAVICNRVNELHGVAAHPTLSWSGENKLDIHVTHVEATKEHAVLEWQKLEDVTKTETIGMGDSGNDIPLFQSVGLKVAVGSATVELKQLADYIAPNQNDGALVHVINRFLLEK